jgi:hypothetical protein
MELEQRHIEALDKAENLMLSSDFCPYLDLKELFQERTDFARARFRSLFIDFYRLGAGGLTNDFKDIFFDILFSETVIVKGHPDFSTILTKLSEMKRRKGDYAMPFSFVSKLVGMHRESSPIYDQHVSTFFGEKPPGTSASKRRRIEWFVGFLERVANSYHTWANDERIKIILERLRSRDPRLGKCHEVRLMDFLVWKVGKDRLLGSPIPSRTGAKARVAPRP